MSFHVPEKHRVTNVFLGSSKLDGNNGFFVFKLGQIQVNCQASDGLGWEHVSVSLDRKRCPDWEEMCFVKNLFWDENDCVIQYHPPKSEYISMHPYCLHLWRPIEKEIPRPPSIMVGVNLSEKKVSE